MTANGSSHRRRACSALGATTFVLLAAVVGCGGGGTEEKGESSSKGTGEEDTCTMAPNCGGCVECFEMCLCTTGDVAGCSSSCSGPTGNPGAGGTGSSGAGGTGGSGGSGGAGNAGTGGGAGAAGAGGGPPVDSCAGKTCGSSFTEGTFCGGPCPHGQGCSASGTCGAWPPHIDQIYDGKSGWQLPPCSYSDSPGADLASAHQYAWIKTMTTVATDCPQIIQDLHPMAKVGNVVPEDQGVYVNGSCVEYSDGQWGTAFDGVIVWGQSWPGHFQGITYTINWRAVIDHNLSPAAGKGVAHLTGLPGDFACSIEMDVTYEKCPTDRNDCGIYPVPY